MAEEIVEGGVKSENISWATGQQPAAIPLQWYAIQLNHHSLIKFQEEIVVVPAHAGTHTIKSI